MWDRTTDRLFLELRSDAVLLFERESVRLLHMNSAAEQMFGDVQENALMSELFSEVDIEKLVRRTVATGVMSVVTMEQVPWFPEQAVIHVVLTEWGEIPAIGVTIDRRPYGPPPEAMQMMKAVLTSAYFTALRIDLSDLAISVVSDKNPLMNTQAKFPSFPDFIQLYAEAMIHPEDREQFLTSFAAEQLRLCLEANTTPACTVRRLQEEEYRWASFSTASVNEHIVLLLGKDSNELHMTQERSDRYRAELKSVSLRNHYIISGAADIFRLMLHVDLATGETMICSVHPSLRSVLSCDTVYSFETVSKMLLDLAHPEDQEMLRKYTTIEQIRREKQDRVILEYRRVSPDSDPDQTAKWTRSVITYTRDESGQATEIVYAVQDIDEQRRKELASQRMQESLTTQFFTLIRNRFLWFVEYDFQGQKLICHQIQDHVVQPPSECPFGQFFERLIMPHCHPEDFKRVALSLLPRAVEEAYHSGKRQFTLDFRGHNKGGDWKYVRGELYIQTDENQLPHAMLYISDIDSEVQSRNTLTRSEHEQLVLRQKFGKMVEDSFVCVGEVDLDADVMYQYSTRGDDFVPEKSHAPFSQLCDAFPQIYVHPEHRARYRETLGYQAILRAAREHVPELKQLFLIDINQDKQYYWCSVAARFFRDQNGKAFIMIYVENLNDEISRRDTQYRELLEQKRTLQDSLRCGERARIRKAHIFLNIASNFQLALNQIYATLDHLEHQLPDDVQTGSDFRRIFTAYERLTAMTECAKDVLLLENNQLPMLSEPVHLPALVRKIWNNAADDLMSRELTVNAFTNHVTQEVVLTDFNRLLYLIENVFINVIRSLPNGSDATFQVTQSAIAGETDRALYECTLVTHGDRVSQDIQSGMCSPIPQHDPLHCLEEAFMMNQADAQQHSLYLSKRLIALMGGELEFTRLPEQASAVTVRLPLKFAPQQVIFPHHFCFGKRAFVWDSQQQSAMSTMELLREAGLISEWQADFEHACAYLRMAVAQEQPYAVIIVRQSDLNRQSRRCLDELLELHKDTPIFVLLDTVAEEHAKPSQQTDLIRSLETPLFRSTLAKALREVADAAGKA